MINKIKNAISKFQLNLANKVVLTEAATGNYVVTPIIAALAGARVYAFTKNSRFGTIEEVANQTNKLAIELNISDRIQIINELNSTILNSTDILTNVGFLRPINNNIISHLSNKCVIPLMWEPWEFRPDELDIKACNLKGIKVYGTNESDKRLKTMDYIGYTVLYYLLHNKLSPFSAKLLLIGCNKFTKHVENVLTRNNYQVDVINNYTEKINLDKYNSIVLLEHENDIQIIGGDNAFINKNNLSENLIVIHICGNVDVEDIKFNVIPKVPAKFGYMSFTTDFIDNAAVIDLHTAGLKVAEGMLKANSLKLKGKQYKNFIEKEYNGLAFENSRFW